MKKIILLYLTRLQAAVNTKATAVFIGLIIAASVPHNSGFRSKSKLISV
ncbi:hypothetical protein [Argonema galeatum]|nr:hypothetical protein [Argonema galeatum]MCL1465928.1 hypothetical protein [Argonema galeatum A003/A1]